MVTFWAFRDGLDEAAFRDGLDAADATDPPVTSNPAQPRLDAARVATIRRPMRRRPPARFNALNSVVNMLSPRM
jgi:hypothetical protein